MQSLVGLLILGLGVIAFLRLNFKITTVQGSSMFPTLKEGDRLLTCKLLPSFWLRRGQIVVGDLSRTELPPLETLSPAIEAWDESLAIEESTEFLESLSEPEAAPIEPKHSRIVKRMTGLPGDTVIIALSSLSADMQTLLKSRCDADGNLVWSVPQDHCFLRGDGVVSIDSLMLGCIPFSAITGIMLLKLPPRVSVSNALPTTSSLS